MIVIAPKERGSRLVLLPRREEDETIHANLESAVWDGPVAFRHSGVPLVGSASAPVASSVSP